MGCFDDMDRPSRGGEGGRVVEGGDGVRCSYIAIGGWRPIIAQRVIEELRERKLQRRVGK
jgi:hypothetical protein